MLNTAKVIKNKNITHDVFELILETASEFKFTSGQFINIKIEDQGTPCFRGYSIASKPNGSQFKLCIKIIENGRGSNWLYSRKPGDPITFLGPIGNLVFKTPPEKEVLIIATGTGIAPFVAIVEDELTKGNQQKIELFFGVRYKEDAIYKDFFEKLEKKYPNFKFNLTLSRPTPVWEGKTGRVTEILEDFKINPDITEVYACGLNPMLQDVKKLLEKRNIPEEAVHFEQYD